MKVLEELSGQVGTAAACRSLGVPRATLYRRRRPPATATPPSPRVRATPPRALSEPERQQVLDVLHSEPFADKAPAEVYAALLDQGQYLCSIRTMYRILHTQQEVRERRDQLRHPAYAKPQLLATAPHQVWSWDITKLLGPARWTYFHLYVILDLFSRYVVGWMLAHRESEHLAERLIRETVVKQGIVRDRLTLHSDRGPSMRSQTVAQLLATLGITKSHSRPHVSDDNPFSESQFKTMKYRPEFPDRFASNTPWSSAAGSSSGTTTTITTGAWAC
jgi:putative transposase